MIFAGLNPRVRVFARALPTKIKAKDSSTREVFSQSRIFKPGRI
jgi:hypothetical protein